MSRFSARKGVEQTDKRWLTRVIDVQQVAVEVQVAMLADLHRGIGRVLGHSAGRKVELGIDSKGRQGHLGQALGGEFGAVDDDPLNGRVGGLMPMGGERAHCASGMRERIVFLSEGSLRWG